MKKKLLERITIHPDICHGKPVIRNKRYPVDMILDLLSSGMTIEDLLEDYPNIEREDIYACLHYAAKVTETKSYTKVLS